MGVISICTRGETKNALVHLFTYAISVAGHTFRLLVTNIVAITGRGGTEPGGVSKHFSDFAPEGLI